MHTTTMTRPSGAIRRGFTLIEVMITVAIIAILASVALPAYSDYVRQGQIQEAFTNLSDFRTKMEQYYQDNRNYGATGTTCATDSGASAWSGFAPSGRKYFTYSCATSSSGQAYTVTATGSAGAATGHVYTINQAGDRATTTYKDATVTAACWLTKGTTC